MLGIKQLGVFEIFKKLECFTIP